MSKCPLTVLILEKLRNATDVFARLCFPSNWERLQLFWMCEEEALGDWGQVC